MRSQILVKILVETCEGFASTANSDKSGTKCFKSRIDDPEKNDRDVIIVEQVLFHMSVQSRDPRMRNGYDSKSSGYSI